MNSSIHIKKLNINHSNGDFLIIKKLDLEKKIQQIRKLT